MNTHNQWGSPNAQFGGIPAHMDDNQKIVLRNERNRKQSPKQLEKIEKQGVSMFTEKLAATIGPSYVASFFVGGLFGLTKIPPPKNRRSRKLIASYYLNSIGKTSARFGNNVGGAIFMYIMVGKFMNFLFLEELEEVSVPAQSAIFGGLTGALYKSTRGKRAMALSTVLGAGIGSAYAYAWGKGYFRFNAVKI